MLVHRTLHVDRVDLRLDREQLPIGQDLLAQVLGYGRLANAYQPVEHNYLSRSILLKELYALVYHILPTQKRILCVLLLLVLPPTLRDPLDYHVRRHLHNTTISPHICHVVEFRSEINWRNTW